ncbi:hypothetical protein CALCODRAFT_482053 [Calocera cornea HHB12733]|uniref:Uncharacterized protein n=1 Tax=Calocera cornea HHB12733 TaxID=1353952 RepID=A0A165H1X5_9BASI|nr:hypothetical protein CALCODRAFT_482053 [Calocera cornea HHB12733]
MPSAQRQHRVATLQPPPAPRRSKTHAVDHSSVSLAWSTQNHASSSSSPDPSHSPLSGIQRRGGLFTVDEAEESALDQYLAGHLPVDQLSASHLPTPKTPFSQSAEFGRSFPFASQSAENVFEYFSPSLGPFAMDEPSPFHIPPPNTSLFEDVTCPPLPGLGIRVPAPCPITETHSPSSDPDAPTYYGSDVTRLRDDTTYPAGENSSDSAGARSSRDIVSAKADAIGLPALDGLPRELMDMTMNMNMNFGSSMITGEDEGHTSLTVHPSLSNPNLEVAGSKSSSPIRSPCTATQALQELGSAPLAASTPLNHFERSRAPPPSLGSRNELVDGRRHAASYTPEENPDDQLQAISISSTPSNSDDHRFHPTPASPSPSPRVPQSVSHAGYNHGQDHDHDLELDHDPHVVADNRHPPDDEPVTLSSEEDDDADDLAVDPEDYQSRLSNWSLTTVEEWKDKLMTVVLGALPTSLELETIQKERMRKKHALSRTKLTNRQASALDRGKHMFQELTRIFLDMLDVPSSVGAQRLGRWSPYLSSESPWNMWQRKWAAEHEEDDFDEEQCRQAYHVFVQDNADYRDILGTWERTHPRADGQKLTESQRLRRWSHFTRELQDRATTWEQTHGFSSVILACTLVPEDKFDHFTFFHETPQMMDFSIQRLGQTSYNARLLAFHWLGDRQARRLTSHPESGGIPLSTGPRRRVPLPTVAKMRKIYADAAIELEKQCAQLNPIANIQVSARARWRDWDSFLIDAGCTMRNWPNTLPWPWDLTENRGSATQALLTPLYYAATGFNNQPKLVVTLWDDEDDPMLVVRADGTAFRLSEYEARKAAALRPLSKAAKRLKKDRLRTRRRGRKRASYNSSSSSGSDEEDHHDHDHDHVARKRPRTSGESDAPPTAAPDVVAPPPTTTTVQPAPEVNARTSGTAAPPHNPQTQRIPVSLLVLPPPPASLPGKDPANHGHALRQEHGIAFMVRRKRGRLPQSHRTSLNLPKDRCSWVVKMVLIMLMPMVEGKESRAVVVIGCVMQSGRTEELLGTLPRTSHASGVTAVHMPMALTVSTVPHILKMLHIGHK